jgi:hypothetical protein
MPRHAGASTHGEESQESQSRAEEGREKEEVKGRPHDHDIAPPQV